MTPRGHQESASALAARDDLHATVELFKQWDADLYALWGPELEKATEPVEVDRKSRAVLRVLLDAVVHWSLPVIEADINEAFDAGSNVAEIIDLLMDEGYGHGGEHTLYDAMNGLGRVIEAREKAGLPVPMSAKGLKPEDVIDEAPWPDPPAFKYQSPSPRHHHVMIQASELAPAWKGWAQARAAHRSEMKSRLQQLGTTAVDTAITWPEPLLDHHMHYVFETGATAQEILETVVFAASAVEGARASNMAAHVPGGFIAMHHGVAALQRVFTERERAGIWAPRDKNSPRVGNASLWIENGLPRLGAH